MLQRLNGLLPATLLALATLIGTATLRGSFAAEIDPSGRVLAVVHAFAPDEEANIDVSEDGQTLFAIRYTRHQRLIRFDGQHLEIFNVSDPRKPRRISDTPMDDAGPNGFLVRSGRLFYLHHSEVDGRLSTRLAIVDVRDPHAPTVLSDTPIDGSNLAVNWSGTMVELWRPPNRHVRYRIPASSGLPEPTEDDSDNLVLVDSWLRHDIKGARGRTYETNDRKAITGDLFTIFVWDLGTSTPQLTASLGLGAQPLDARFLAVSNTLAVLNARGVEIVSASPHSLDPARLVDAHRQLLVRYNEAVRRRDGKPESILAAIDLYGQLAAAMKDAGAAELMSEAAVSLPRATRVQILNDYGFWLSRTNEPGDAVPVLKKVTEIDPGRVVAQLNLADAAIAALPKAGTWDEKKALSEIVVNARGAYRRLTGKMIPGEAEFAAFNAATAANEDICDYIAGFYNRGRQDEMFGFPDPVDIAGDGVKRHVYIYHEGTANFPGIVATTEDLNQEGVIPGFDTTGDVNLFMSDDKDYPSPSFGLEPRVMPFRNGYHVLYEGGGPVVVYRPNRGAVCQFTAHYTPMLTVNRDPENCTRALDGRSFDRVSTEPLNPSGPLPGGGDLMQLGRIALAQFQAFADVKPDPSGEPIRMGYFEIESGAGAGCSMSGVAILDHDRVEDSLRNHALMAAENQLLDCRRSSAFVVRGAAGQTLIELDSGPWRGEGIVTRSLLSLHSRQVDTVCQVDQRVEYEPERIPDGRDLAQP